MHTQIRLRGMILPSPVIHNTYAIRVCRCFRTRALAPHRLRSGVAQKIHAPAIKAGGGPEYTSSKLLGLESLDFATVCRNIESSSSGHTRRLIRSVMNFVEYSSFIRVTHTVYYMLSLVYIYSPVGFSSCTTGDSLLCQSSYSVFSLSLSNYIRVCPALR